MSDLWSAGLAEDNGDHVESERAVVDVMRCKKIMGGLESLFFFGGGDDGLGGTEGFVCSGFYLNKNDTAIGIDHNKVDFAGFAQEVAGEGFEAFSFQEFFAASFAPSAEACSIGQQLSSYQNQVCISYTWAIGRRCACCVGGRV